MRLLREPSYITALRRTSMGVFYSPVRRYEVSLFRREKTPSPSHPHWKDAIRYAPRPVSHTSRPKRAGGQKVL